jgi:biotin carboxyl carrier protein
MSAVAIVTTSHVDAERVVRAVRGALAVVDSAPATDVIVTDERCLAPLLRHLRSDTPIVVLGAPAAPPACASHVITPTWPDEQVRTLLLALARRCPQAEPVLVGPRDPSEARSAQRAIAAARKLLGVTDLAVCESSLVEILVELIECDRAYCLFHDPEDGALWSQRRYLGDAGDDRRAVHGLAGYAARTGEVAMSDSAGADPRFHGAVDDPHGDPSDHVVAQPVYGSDGLVHAVLVCTRRVRRHPFGAPELALLARFARLVTPLLDQLSIEVQAQAILDQAEGRNGLFRREALASRDQKAWGEVVRISPAWLSWAYRLLVALLAVTTVFLFVGEVSTYSTGQAIIRSSARTPVTARTDGNIVAVEVVPGSRVARGTVLARLDDTDQRAAVTSLEHELETQLRNHMLDMTDPAADAAVRSIRKELESARASLAERLIVSTVDGVVGDISVRAGQHVSPGDLVAAVLDEAQGFEVIAMLPGADRPQLAPGMTLRVELAGYQYAYQSVAIEQVASDVIAPSEARRVLGAEVADGVQIGGPVVIVRGRLTSSEFVADDRVFHYHDGMRGTAEVRVASEPIVFALVPGLRRFR